MKLFLSYTSSDRDWAHWIGVTLRDAGHDMFVHEWEVAAGENIPAWMERKLEAADKMVGIFSPAYVEAVHSNAERWAAYWQDPDGRDGFLVPIEVEKLAKWPAFAAGKRRLSLIGLDEAEAARKLIAFLEPPRAPTTRPRFPGGSGGGGETRPSTGTADVRLGDATLSAEGTSLPFDAGSSALPSDAPRFPSELDEAAGGSAKSPVPKTRGRQFASHSVARGNPSPIIRSREDLQRWLKDKPREFSRILAVRAALRVAPLLVGLEVRRSSNVEGPSALLLPLLRGMAAPWAPAKFPARGAEVRLVAYAAADAAAYAAAVDAAAAAYAAAYAAADAAPAAADAAAAAADTAAAASWEAVTIDVSLLVGSADTAALAGAKLWPNGVPAAIAQALVDLSNQLLSRHDEGWQHWLDWLNDRFSDEPVRRAGDEEKDIARLTVPEEMWAKGTKTIAGVKAVNAEIARRLAEIDARRKQATQPQETAAPEPPSLEPGQTYRFGEDGLEFVPAEGPAPDFVRATQAAIHGELRLAIADLRAISVAKNNEHPGLCAAVSRYAEMIDRPLDHLDPTRLMTVGIGLTAYATAFQSGDVALSMEGALEPTHFAELVRSAELHRALMFGFPELRPTVERSDAVRRGDPDAMATAARPLGRLLNGLANARTWVADTTRQGLAIADDAFSRFGLRSWDASFNAYELVRNGLITTSVAVADVFGLLATVPGAVALTIADPSFAATIGYANAASTFLVAHADDIAALATSFPEMKAWFDWVLGRLRSLQ